ncbi:hypothetical protein MD484_g3876, partial [Candolleomyces efflorescens]
MPSTEGLVAGTDTQGAPENQFGLFGAKELSHVIEACRKEVERVGSTLIFAYYPPPGILLTRDPDFDLQFDFVTCTHGLTESSLPAGEDVHRVTELFENPHFFPDGGAANSNAIKQGELGDCWFLAALATVSCIPGLIEKICVARDEEVGVYGFIFYGDKGWSSVIVDDMLYTKIPKYEDLDERSQAVYHEDKDKYDRIARKNGASLLFAKPGSEQETWVPLIEKAYAKFYGTYAHLEGGWSRDGIENLTGGISAEFITKDILDVERFWEEELLQEVIEADFVNIAKHTTESQEQKEKETPTPDGVSTASTGERAADTKPPVDAKEGGDACELGFAAEKATQTSAASAPTDDVTAKAEGTKADLKVIDRFYSRLLVATLLGCLNFLAIVTLALIWALKSPLREDNSNVSANSSSDSESVSSVDEMKPSLSTVYYCPLLHPDMPSTSLPNPSPSATQTPPGPPWKDLLKEDSKDVVLGLRVYTQTKDPAKIVYRLGGDNSG